MRIRFLTFDEVIRMHAAQIEAFGGMHGIRDSGLLESALMTPQVTFDQKLLHTDPFEIAAIYIFHLIKNHPFIDGNKRIGIIAGLVFLKIHGIEIYLSQEETYGLGVDVATSKITKKEIVQILKKGCS